MKPVSDRPLVAITMGDAAGIGPGLIVRVLSESLRTALATAISLADPG
jgi:4-hydroxy-L-threonine phosphate dehydrogenase PdxA